MTKQIDQVIEEAMNLHGKINLSIASLIKPLDEEQLEFYYFCEDHMPQILDEIETLKKCEIITARSWKKLLKQNQIMIEALGEAMRQTKLAHPETFFKLKEIRDEAIKKASEV